MDAHRYCFTPCPGLGALGPACVWRTNVEADWPSHVYPFFYSGLADPIWWRRRRRGCGGRRCAERLRSIVERAERIADDRKALGGDLRDLIHPESVGAALPGDRAVVFARNHDTAMAPGFFNFGDPQDAALALATLYLVWSSTYLALRLVVAELPVFLSSGARFVLAGETERGDDTLRVLAELLPDVLILDLNMPVMNGQEFLIEKRRFNLAPSTPVIVFTANGRRSKIEGVSEWVRKPVDLDRLLNIVGKYCKEYVLH